MSLGDNLSPLTAHPGLLPPNPKSIPPKNNNDIDTDDDNDNHSVGTFNTLTLSIDKIEQILKYHGGDKGDGGTSDVNGDGFDVVQDFEIPMNNNEDEKLLNDPPLTLMSFTVKLAVAKLEVNVIVMALAPLVDPELIVLVIAIVGATDKPVSRVIVSLPTSEINKFPFAYTYKSLGAEYESDNTTPVVAPLAHFTTLSFTRSSIVTDPSELDLTVNGVPT